MRWRIATFVLTVAAAVFCMLLASCGNAEPQVLKAAKQKILLVGNSADPSTLDPTLSTGLGEFKILSGLFEGLVRADEDTLRVEPAAAESWEVSEGGKVYTFRLRDGLRWSDGGPLKASDFVFAWRRALNPSIGAEYASLMYCIKNAEAINSGREKNLSALGARALDSRTLRIELEAPTPYFLNMLYLNIFFPLPEHVLKKFGAAESRNSFWTRAGNMVSNGAFILSAWRINDKVSIRRNPLYWDTKSIKINGVDFFPIGNANTEDRAFRAGQLHITDSVPISRMDSIRAKLSDCLRSEDWLGTYYYIFNTRRPPFDDSRVRRALSMSINRGQIIEAFLKAGQKPAFALVPPNCSNSWRAGEAPHFFENIAEARRLLSEAGYPEGKGFPKFKLVYNTSEIHKPIAEAIQQMWRENLGIEAELYNLSWPAYLAARRAGDFDVARSNWVGDFDAPETFLGLFESSSGLSHTGYGNPLFDAAMAKARSSADNAERIEALKSAENILMRDMPLMPIYFYSRVCLVSPILKNWKSNILDYHNYRNVDFYISEPL